MKKIIVNLMLTIFRKKVRNTFNSFNGYNIIASISCTLETSNYIFRKIEYIYEETEYSIIKLKKHEK